MNKDVHLIWEAYVSPPTHEQVNSDQLEKGIEVEMEHTKDPKVAEKIARDHLKEDPEYYTKLIKAGL